MNYTRHVAKLNDVHIPIGATHYHGWLRGHINQSRGPMSSALAYLQYLFGFRYGEDSITQDALDTLRTIHDYYWYRDTPA